jgi:type IV pilus modification protein PilV
MRRIQVERPEEGFSLIEVLIAVLILTVGLLALAQLMLVATRANSISSHVTSTSALAKERMERLKAEPFYTNAESLVANDKLKAGGDLTKDLDGFHAYYDSSGRDRNSVANPVPAKQSAYVVRWEIVDMPGIMAMKRISVRCLSSAETGETRLYFSRIGEATLVTYRTANVS